MLLGAAIRLKGVDWMHRRLASFGAARTWAEGKPGEGWLLVQATSTWFWAPGGGGAVVLHREDQVDCRFVSTWLDFLGAMMKASKILNVEEHSQFLLKQKKNLDDYRPDILHRSLLAIIDSPVWKRGMVQAIYVKIDNGVLFEVKPDTRIPRMHKRFYGLMVDLLKKSCITASDKHAKLLRVVQQPVTQHLPSNSRIIGLSHSSEKLVKLTDYVASINDDVNLVFVVGLMMQGEIDKTYIDDFISVSRHQLSSSGTIGGFVCDALEEIWNII